MSRANRSFFGRPRTIAIAVFGGRADRPRRRCADCGRPSGGQSHGSATKTIPIVAIDLETDCRSVPSALSSEVAERGTSLRPLLAGGEPMEVKDPAAQTFRGRRALRIHQREQAPRSQQRPSTRRPTTLATSSGRPSKASYLAHRHAVTVRKRPMYRGSQLIDIFFISGRWGRP
jgi:hypothetical protein